MTTAPKILAFSGSLRAGSLNHTLVEAAARHAEEAGAEVRVIRLRDFPMAIYDGDLEASGDWPEAVDALRSGLNVMIFSDNVPVDQEIALKRLAPCDALHKVKRITDTQPVNEPAPVHGQGLLEQAADGKARNASRRRWLVTGDKLQES